MQGFGSTASSTRAPGFDVPLAAPGGNLQDRYDKRVIDKADKEVMPRFDRDKDGFLSTEESKESDWDPPFADSDLDKDGRLSRFELYERYAKKLNLPPKTAMASGSAATVSKPAESSTGGNDQGRLAAYAKGFLNQYDKNKNGVLEKEEWTFKSDHFSADINKDNVITLDELSAKFAADAKAMTASSSPAAGSSDRGRGRFGGGGRGGDRSDRSTSSTDPKKSYRVLTATERLPKGLPDWFARNDIDADGQVSMAEYMTEFTDARAAEFASYDLNGDGIITPEECLEAEGK